MLKCLNFQEPKNPAASTNIPKPASAAAFEDLLSQNGFTSSSAASDKNRTIGEMKKAEDIKMMDPDTARIFEWTHGKQRNLRALLCSLDTVVWEGSR